MSAVRADLADVRLAEYVFAPHYAAPLLMTATRRVEVRADAGKDAAMVCHLAPGDMFEVLDLSGTNAWGVAPGAGLVGYVERAALAPVAGSGT